jgi:hypothetical protein
MDDEREYRRAFCTETTEELRAARVWIERQTAFWERAIARLHADLETP